MEEIKEEVQQNKFTNSQGTDSNDYQPLENNYQYIPDAPNNGKTETKKNVKVLERRIKKSAGVFMITAIVAMIVYSSLSTSKSVDTSDAAKEAMETHMSTTLAAGTKLMSKDESFAGGDLTITHNSKEDETKIYVWDYAAEDGDYVQIIIDGTPLGEPFMIMNKPVSFSVPTVGDVQVKGTRDGGGGITYGVYCEVNHTTYFNGVDVGDENIYTLIRE